MYQQIKRLARKNPSIKNLYRELVRADITERKFMELEEKVIYKYIYDLEQRVAALEEKSGVESTTPKLLESTDDPLPTLENPISQVATANQLQSPIFKDWCQRLGLPNYPNRKTWEFVYICRVLELNGMIKPGKKGVGFGVGKDPMVAYFAKNGVDVLATDLDINIAKQKGWVHTNQFSKSLDDLNENGITSDKNLRNHVKLRSVDMNSIPDDIEGYDFTWSACAFEHLGSIENGLEFVKNSLKCLKPGGIAVHTTEFNASSDEETLTSGPTVLFRRKDIEKLAEALKVEGHQVKLNFHCGNSYLDQFYDVPPYSDYTHLKLKLQDFLTSSFGFEIQKSNS